jgi:hypothetical protein
VCLAGFALPFTTLTASAATTATSTDTLILTAGALSVVTVSAGSVSAALSSSSPVSSNLAVADWGDTTGSGAGWNGTMAVSLFNDTRRLGQERGRPHPHQQHQRHVYRHRDPGLLRGHRHLRHRHLGQRHGDRLGVGQHLANNGSTATGGTATTVGSGVKFVSAALNTGMGSFRVTPSGTIAFDGNLDWAGAYVAQVSYSIVTGP